MQMHNDVDGRTQSDAPAFPAHEYTEQRGYMGSQQYYEQPTGQPFQQPAYSSPIPGYGPVPSYGQSHSGQQQQFAGTPPPSDMRFSAVLSYSCGWLTGLLFLLFGGKDRFVRFHALQSLVFFGVINVIDVGLLSIILSSVGRDVWGYQAHLVAILCTLLFLVLNFIAFVSWIAAIVQATHGVYFRLPFVGELVARRFKPNAARPRW